MITRVSQRGLYSTQIYNMNNSLAKLVELNEQSSTQKRINKPSDDPTGAARVLAYRDSMNATDRYQANITSAQGWLKQADSTLTSVNTIITRLKEIAEQGATGTMSADNREAISYEARQLYSQLIGLANTRFEDKSLFAGQKTDASAFQEVLSVTAEGVAADPADSAMPTVKGSTKHTVVIRAKASGTANTLAGGDFEYSTDGGKSFTSAGVTLADGDGDGRYTLSLPSGVEVTMAGGTTFTAYNAATDTGSVMKVRPAAQYMGDDEDAVGVTKYGASATTASAAGAFQSDVMVRIDSTSTLEGAIAYSYSVDNGANWVTGNNLPAAAGSTSRTLPIPGGLLTLAGAATDSLTGSQFVVSPRQADINVEISPTEKVTVNGVGKDIFGGLYENPSTGKLETVNLFGDANRNLFETAGNLVAALETNDQDACGAAVENLRAASQHILTQAASVGGRENRLTTAAKVLDAVAASQEEGLSKVEDADYTELLTNLANQELIYQTVLKSSSTIMNISLLNYL